MPRDGTETRERLILAAERLFATRGVHQATSREIVEEAGQRNVSALTYHFGSREGVLWAILARHNDPIDARRGERIVEPIGEMSTRDLVGALLVPYAQLLTSEEGRDYLQIVAQLTEMFTAWSTGPLSPPNVRRLLGAIDARTPGRPAVRQARLLAMLMLITSAFAERAHALNGPAAQERTLDEEAFLANLADMLVGAIEAPLGAPLTRTRTAPVSARG